VSPDAHDDDGVALDRLRSVILEADQLVRALASGRRKGQPSPVVEGREVRRVEIRPVDLKAGRHLQVTSYDDTQAHTANLPVGEEAEAAVHALLAQPFAHWHVDTTTHTHQARVTKKGAVLVHSSARKEVVETSRGHDRDKGRLLREDDPALVALGISDAQGKVKPSRQAKYRQVEEFLRLLDSSLADGFAKGHLRTPTPEDPLRIVDLGCGNAYMTFAAPQLLTAPAAEGGRGLPVRMTGIDVRQQSADHNSEIAARLGIEADFVVGSITEAELEQPPDVVLALHACDTATDDALARAVEWEAPLVLAAPCCHHDIAAQLRKSPPPAPHAALTRDGILRERLADTLTDALRAELLRGLGYRVDVVQFVESAHTPRNTMIRAVRVAGGGGTGSGRSEYDDLASAWGVRPRLGELLGRAP
jgi:SAM-dependent methyltransferase